VRLVDEVEPRLVHVLVVHIYVSSYYFLLVDVELVVDIVPMKKRVDFISIYEN
jgi:hypothetical protein